jgi:2-polyprenyl-6-methoxyphenol hydroxylase-like FAD-dependent oxidoreductase
MSSEIRDIVIVGGGAAGWLTAGIIAAGHRVSANPDLTVTLLESPDVKTLGVGEGTWPSMRDTLRHLGISESEFIRDCDASFKQGSKFVGWASGDDNEHYYHPFMAPHGYGETNLVSRWREQHIGTPYAELVSSQPHLCERGRAPKQKATPEFAAVANYAYHLDAGKFGHFLQAHCTEKLGVTHVLDHVHAINSTDNGDIESLQTADHNELKGDLFIDCTGFASLLLGQHYRIPFVSRKDVLFNDMAIAVQVPNRSERSPIASQTTSTAQKAGWIWDIALPSSRAREAPPPRGAPWE